MLTKSLQKKYNVISSEAIEPVKTVSTGNVGLDYLLGGGLPVGKVIEIYGPNQLGKTIGALSLSKGVLQQNRNVAFIDAEHSLNPQYLKTVGISQPLIVNFPKSLDDAVSFLMEISQDPESNCGCIILDSIPCLQPDALLEKLEDEPGKSNMAGQARFWSVNQGRVLNAMSINNCSLILINQIRSNLSGYGNPLTTPGGASLGYMSSIRLALTGNGKIDEEASKVGQRFSKTTYTVIKNKLIANKGTSCEMFIGNNGLDPYLPMISLAKELKILSGVGWYTFPANFLDRELPKVQGTKGLYNLISDPANLDLYNKLYDTIIQSALSSKEPIDLEDDQD